MILSTKKKILKTVSLKCTVITCIFFFLGILHCKSDEFDVPLGKQGIFGSPSSVVFKGHLYIFYQDINEKGYIEYRFQDSDGTWFLPKRIPDTRTSTSPNAIVFNDTLYVFHQGMRKSGDIWYNTFDGENWSKDTKMNKVKLSESPGLVVFQKKLWLFFQGKGNQGIVWHTTYDGKKWSKQEKMKEVGITGSPSPVVFQNKLYLFNQSKDKDNSKKLKVSSTYDGKTWNYNAITPEIYLSESPKAVVYNEDLYIFYQDKDHSNKLKYFTINSSNRISKEKSINDVFMSAFPNAIVHNNQLKVFYQFGENKGYLWQVKKDLNGWNMAKPLINFSFNDRDYLDRKFGDLTLLGTHSSFIGPPVYKEDNNQEVSVLYQLNQGVRYIEMDLYRYGLFLGITKPGGDIIGLIPNNRLNQISSWLRKNPNELLLIRINTDVDPKDVESLFKETDLYNLLFTEEGFDYPNKTPRDIINKGKQVLIFGKSGVSKNINSGLEPYITKSSTWNMTKPYSEDTNPISLTDDPLYLLGMFYAQSKHFIGNKDQASIINEYYYAESYLHYAWRQSQIKPMVVVADFTTYGDILEAIHHINNKYNSFSGKIRDESGNIIDSVTLKINYSIRNITETSLARNFFNVPIGMKEEVTITPSKEGYVFEPTTWSFINTVGTDLDITFTGKLLQQKESTASANIDEIKPNPFVNNVSLSFNNDIASKVELEVYTINGTMIDKSSYMMGKGLQQLNYNTSSLSKGVYLFNIKTNGKTKLLKGVKN